MQDLQAMVVTDHERMLAAFVNLDREERAARKLLDEFVIYRPERARATTILARHQQLSDEAIRLNVEYLQVTDRFPEPDQVPPTQLREAGSTYRSVAIRLEEMAERFAGLLANAAGELREVLAAKERIKSLQSQVEAHLATAESAVTALSAAGLSSGEVDDAFRATSLTAREAVQWDTTAGLPALERLAALAAGSAAKAEAAARDYPQEISKIPTRARSLRTRLASVRTRTGGIAEDMRELRRGYRSDAWIDLDRRGDEVQRLLDSSEVLCADLDRAVAEKRFDQALALVDQTKEALDQASNAADAPRRRLQALEEISRKPEHAVAKARFAVRDAQLLVVSGDPSHLTTFSGELDRLVLRVQDAETLATGPRPQWWVIRVELDEITKEVAALVTRYRDATRN